MIDRVLRLIHNFFATTRYYLILTGPVKGLYIYMALRHGIKKVLGVYEPEVARVIKKEVHDSFTCVDIGCHVGYFSLLMAKQVGSRGSIVAIDPILSNTRAVDKSFKKNRYSNGSTVTVGIGDKKKEVMSHIYTDSDMANFSDSLFRPSATAHAKHSLSVVTLDSLVDELQLQKVNFIKIDVEGYEEYVIDGASKTLKKFSPILLIEVHNSEIGKRILAKLRKMNYKVMSLVYEEIDPEYFSSMRDTQLFILCKK